MSDSIKRRGPRGLILKACSVLLVLLGSACLSVQAQQGPPPSAAPAAPGKEATLYGQKIHYVEAGRGPTVILLHGLGGSNTHWARNVGPLAEHFRVIVPDQIGFGRSDKPFINYRIATYVDFLDALYKELKIERASLVGNSMGGWIGAAYALAHPEKVERLVLVDAAGFTPRADFDARTLSFLNPSTREGMRQLAALIFFNKRLFTGEAAIDLMLTQRISAGDGYTIQSLNESVARREDMLDNRLGAIKQPTLLIWGRADGLTPLAEFGERFHKEIAGSQLLVLDRCGHVPQIECAAEFNAALLKFLTAPAK